MRKNYNSSIFLNANSRLSFSFFIFFFLAIELMCSERLVAEVRFYLPIFWTMQNLTLTYTKKFWHYTIVMNN